MTEVIGHSREGALIPGEPVAPVRVKLSRAKGWRMPANTVKVDRTTRWGNPFTKADAIDSGYASEADWQSFVVECFRDWIGPTKSGRDWWSGPESDRRRASFVEGIGALRGKNLACWCALDAPCHADVLLELANAPGSLGMEARNAGRNETQTQGGERE